MKYYGTGRRKNAVAKVWLTPGNGEISVNNKGLIEYFGKKTLEMIVKQPLELTETLAKFDVTASVHGGGISGQAGAIRHGLARAIVAADETTRAALKKAGCMTRDSRMKERKKPGQPGARKRFQFSKR